MGCVFCPTSLIEYLKERWKLHSSFVCNSASSANLSFTSYTVQMPKTKHHVWMYSSEYPAVCLWDDDKGRRRDAADREEEEENKTEACAEVNKDAERTWEVLARATMSRTAEADVADRYCSQKTFLSTSSLFSRKHWNIKLSVMYSVKCLCVCVCVKCRSRDVRHAKRLRNICYEERRFLGHRGGRTGGMQMQFKDCMKKNILSRSYRGIIFSICCSNSNPD